MQKLTIKLKIDIVAYLGRSFEEMDIDKRGQYQLSKPIIFSIAKNT